QASAFDDLQHVLPHLDWVVPTWLNLQGTNLDLKDAYNDRVFNYIRRSKPNVAIVPVLQNASMGKWDGEGLARLLASPARRKNLINGVTAFVSSHHLQGITIDFEQLPDTSYSDLAVFMKELSRGFSPKGWVVVDAAPFDDDDWPFTALAPYVDYTLLMAYDQ